MRYPFLITGFRSGGKVSINGNGPLSLEGGLSGSLRQFRALPPVVYSRITCLFTISYGYYGESDITPSVFGYSHAPWGAFLVGSCAREA